MHTMGSELRAIGELPIFCVSARAKQGQCSDNGSDDDYADHSGLGGVIADGLEREAPEV